MRTAGRRDHAGGSYGIPACQFVRNRAPD